jgi:hypothetical protein
MKPLRITCSKCRQEKPRAEFYTGRITWCKRCCPMAAYLKNNSFERLWREMGQKAASRGN